MMIVVTFITCILLVLIESDLCLCLKNLTFRPVTGPKDIEDLDLDEDVLEEEQRVADMITEEKRLALMSEQDREAEI